MIVSRFSSLQHPGTLPDTRVACPVWLTHESDSLGARSDIADAPLLPWRRRCRATRRTATTRCAPFPARVARCRVAVVADERVVAVGRLPSYSEWG